MTIIKNCGCEVDPRDGCIVRYCRLHDPERKPWYVWWLWALVLAFSVLGVDSYLRSREVRFATTWNCAEIGAWQHRVELVRVDGITLLDCEEKAR